MSTFKINTGADDLDELCKETNIESIPGFDGFFSDLERQRNNMEDNARITSFGRSTGFTNGSLGAMWLARIPKHIVAALTARHGVEWFNSLEFMWWLKKNSQFTVGRVESRM